MRKITEKLPTALQDRWRRKAQSILEKDQRTVTCQDLVEFIEWEVRTMSNPLFGVHLYGSTGSQRDSKTHRDITSKMPIKEQTKREIC